MDETMTWAEKLEYIFTKRKAAPQREQVSDRVNRCINFVSADNETLEYEVETKIEEWMKNPRNELHGGVCCTFFDTTTAIAAIALANGKKVATVDLYTNFIARMPGDETLVIKTKVIKAGRTFTRFSAEAHSKESGRLIATCMSNYTVLNEPHPINRY